MAKIRHPFAPIPGLCALHELFRKYAKLPESTTVTEAAYNELLSEALTNAGVLDKRANDSFIIGLKGKPVESEPNRTSGMDVNMLDRIAAIVIEHYDLIKRANLNEEENKKIPLTWETFSKQIFKTPPHLEVLNEKRYVKFLNETEKADLDEYLARRYNELGFESGSAVNYCVYIWSSEHRRTKYSILSIDPVSKSATYYYFPDDLRSNQPKSILTTLRYSHGNSILNLDMVEQDPAKSHIRVNLLLSIFDQFANLPYVKGVMTATMENATFCMCAEIALEKCGSYADAWKKVLGEEKRSNELSLEVLNRRYEVKETNIYSLDKLRSYSMLLLLQEIHGFYLLEYVTQFGASNGANKLQKGLCHISEDGLVKFKFPTLKDELLKGYMDQQKLRDGNFININYFIDRPIDRYDAHYKLEIVRGFDNEGWPCVKYLYGCYTSFSIGTIYKGDIVMLKLDGKGYKKEDYYVDFKDVENDKISINESIDVSGNNWKSLEGLDKIGYEILKKKKYDHLSEEG